MLKYILKYLLVSLITVLRPFFGPQGYCKYKLTCTEYAEMELEYSNFFRAIVNITKRVFSCQNLI